MDWGAGRYEETARQLEPASEYVVGLAGLAPGKRLLDVGCGTGNAALLAARAGAAVVGVDPASRLLGVARERAAASGLDAEFVEGHAEELPFEDASFDIAISVFGVIFAEDPEGAIGEMLRVVGPGGRVLIAAWRPEGPITTMMSAFGRAIATATKAPVPERFPWHDHDRIAEIAGRHNAGVESFDHDIQFSGASPEAFFAEQDASHPLSIASRALLVNAGLHEGVKREAIAILEDGNEDPKAFRVTSPYRVHRLQRN